VIGPTATLLASTTVAKARRAERARNVEVGGWNPGATVGAKRVTEGTGRWMRRRRPPPEPPNERRCGCGPSILPLRPPWHPNGGTHGK
jgi:hypothetical protein